MASKKAIITLLLAALSVLMCPVRAGAQSLVTLNVENAVLKSVLDQITSQTDYTFVYTNEIKADETKVTFHCSGSDIESVCASLFPSLGLDYTVKEGYIALSLSRGSADDSAYEVKGTVTENGEPLPYVYISVEGTDTFTTSADDGTYAISVPGPDATLLFSLVGMEDLHIPVGGRSIVNAQMSMESNSLEELVVVGYGVQMKKDVTSSISQIKGNDIAENASSSFIQQLAGRASGVQVTTSGLIGAPPKVIIRGVNSISSGTSPLYVINGVPVTSGGLGGSYTNNNAMADINPSDIESFEILKDGAATAIYGSRAANGVILITTKQGKRGPVQVNYDGWVGFGTPSRMYDLLNAEQFVEISNEKFANIGQGPQAFMDENNTDTDWLDQIYRVGFQHSHSLSITGGMESTQFYSSIGYTKQNGIMKNNSFERFSFYGKVDHSMFKNIIKIGFSLNASAQNNSSPKKGVSLFSDNVYCSTKLFPNVPIYDPDDPTGYNVDDEYPKRVGRGANLLPIDADFPNIVWVLDHNYCKNESYRLIPTAYLDITPIKGLNNRFLVSADVSALKNSFNQNPEHGDGAGRNGLVNETWYRRQRWTIQDILTWNHSFGLHNIDLTGVAEWTHFLSESVGAEVTNLSDPYYSQTIISETFSNQIVDGSSTQNGMTSFVFRANYNYNSTWYIGGSIRYDGLSKLAPENRWGLFYGASAAIRFSNLNFWKNGGIGRVLTDFRIRGSYAEVGNDDIGNFLFNDTFGPAMYGSSSALIYSNVGNKDLRWERQKILDVGFDLSLFDRVNLSFAYWQKNNSDIILSVPTPPSLGIPGNSISQNYGDVENNGIEFEIGGVVVDKGDFSWSSSLNFTTQNSRVDRLVSDIISNSVLLIREGEPLYSIYVHRYAGVNMANGNPMYYKKDGSIVQCNPIDGKYYVYDPSNPNDMSRENNLLDEDKEIIGTTIPKWFGGFNNTFTYKNWDLNIFLRFSGGNYIFNHQRINMLSMGFYNNSTEILGRWQSPENPGDGQTPKLYYNKTSQVSYTNSSRWVEKGDFLKIQDISLGYSFPYRICQKMLIQKLRLYIQAQNLATFSTYSGLDPESYTSALGIDRSGEPQQMQFLFGISIGF